MNQHHRRSRPSWRVETRAFRPELWAFALGLVGMLLVEVWQNARVAELSLRLDQTRTALDQTRARMEFVRADLERRTTRAELAPLASRMGLAPADAQQVVVLPSAYLAAETEPVSDNTPVSLLAMAERVSRTLVPEATARGRNGN